MKPYLVWPLDDPAFAVDDAVDPGVLAVVLRELGAEPLRSFGIVPVVVCRGDGGQSGAERIGAERSRSDRIRNNTFGNTFTMVK